MRAKVQSRRKPPVVAGKAITLARPGDPLVTSDGKQFKADPIGAKEEHEKASRNKVTPVNFKPSVRRSIRDMPAQGNPLKAIACVLVFSIMGLTERDTADALGIDLDQLRRIKGHAAYDECFNSLLGEFINANSEILQSRVAAYGDAALRSIADIAFEGKEEKNKLKASIDLLDRNDNVAGGTKAKTQQNVLRIEITNAQDAESGVKLELNGEEM